MTAPANTARTVCFSTSEAYPRAIGRCSGRRRRIQICARRKVSLGRIDRPAAPLSNVISVVPLSRFDSAHDADTRSSALAASTSIHRQSTRPGATRSRRARRRRPSSSLADYIQCACAPTCRACPHRIPRASPPLRANADQSDGACFALTATCATGTISRPRAGSASARGPAWISISSSRKRWRAPSCCPRDTAPRADSVPASSTPSKTVRSTRPAAATSTRCSELIALTLALAVRDSA